LESARTCSGSIVMVARVLAGLLGVFGITA